MRGVGRARKKDKHLPQRVYQRHGAFYFADKLTGKWHPLGKSYPDALKALATRLAAAAPIDTIERLMAKYEAEELPSRALKTQKGRLQEFKQLRKVFGRVPASDVKPHHVWTYWRTRGQTEQARHEVRALSAILTFARRCGALHTENPCFGLRLPQGEPRRRYVTDEEFLLVRAIAQPMIAHAMNLAFCAGMDSGTIRKLERRHLLKDGIQFERRKTKMLQLIEWNDDLRSITDAIKAERPQLRQVLICNRKGKAYSANGLEAQWQRTMRRALGIKNADGTWKHAPVIAERFTLHDLRAKSASDSGSDQEAADRLGHGDAQVTRAVYRRLPRRAVALNLVKT